MFYNSIHSLCAIPRPQTFHASYNNRLGLFRGQQVVNRFRGQQMAYCRQNLKRVFKSRGVQKIFKERETALPAEKRRVTFEQELRMPHFSIHISNFEHKKSTKVVDKLLRTDFQPLLNSYYYKSEVIIKMPEKEVTLVISGKKM